MSFNLSEREKQMENDIMIAQQQNREAEQYMRHQADEKNKKNKLKKAKAAILLKE